MTSELRALSSDAPRMTCRDSRNTADFTECS